MFAATKGVNTHKGILFLLGILGAACGVCYKRQGDALPDSRAVLAAAAEIAAPFLEQELAEIASRTPKTHGEKLYVRYGIRGVRGEVLSGFRSLYAVAFPAMAAAKSRQPDQNAARLYVLLKLMASVEDTNILSRSDRQTLEMVHRLSARFLEQHPILNEQAVTQLRQMNRQFTQWGISPGGCADLLAITLFFEKMQQKI